MLGCALDKVDGVVIGAGVVGLAVARALVQAHGEGVTARDVWITPPPIRP